MFASNSGARLSSPKSDPWPMSVLRPGRDIVETMESSLRHG
jgi:hypothetical protein